MFLSGRRSISLSADQPAAFLAAAVCKVRAALAAAGVDAHAYSRDRLAVVPTASVPACRPLHLFRQRRNKAAAVGVDAADLLEEVGGIFDWAAAEGKCHSPHRTASVASVAAVAAA